MAAPEVVGGIPLISANGTPRSIGETIGSRLKSRLQVLSQYLREQLTAAISAAKPDGSADPLSNDLKQLTLTLATSDPTVWMELESMARAAEVSEEDLLIVYGYSDLLSRHRCAVPPVRSGYLALTGDQTDTGHPRLVYTWHLDPALFPYLTLVRRQPSHGPATLGLSLAGMYPVAALTESGIAGCVNELRVMDGRDGYFTAHLLASVLTAPGFAEAAVRVQRGPRQGGAAVHLMDAQGQRLSVELSGQETATLPDPHPASPRVHTNHALNPAVLTWCSAHGDPTSKDRLRWLAGHAVEAKRVDPVHLANWFGLGGKLPPVLPEGMGPETSVFVAFDPKDRKVYLKRGAVPGMVEVVPL